MFFAITLTLTHYLCVCVFDIEGLVRETGGLAIKNLAG